MKRSSCSRSKSASDWFSLKFPNNIRSAAAFSESCYIFLNVGVRIKCLRKGIIPRG